MTFSYTDQISLKVYLLMIQKKTNTITTSDGQEFRVVATKSDIETGFDGLAVAPIVNGKADYKNVAVIAARTDLGNPTMIDRFKITFSYYSVIQTNLIV